MSKSLKGENIDLKCDDTSTSTIQQGEKVVGVGTDGTCRIELNTLEFGLPLLVAMFMLTVVRLLSPGEE